jgi:hypothetical protein
VNTNTTLPVVTLTAGVDNPQQWLDFGWTNGVGERNSVTIGLDMLAHDGGQQGLRDNVWAMLQHVYLMGADAVGGQDDDLVARNERQRIRIEQLVRDLEHINGLHSNQARTINTMQSQLDEAIESYNTVRRHAESLEETISQRDQAILGLHRDIAGVAEERDAVADSLDQAQVPVEAITNMTEVTVPTVLVVDNAEAVTIYRAGSNFNVGHWGVHGDDGKEVLAANLRGALADAFHAGQREASQTDSSQVQEDMCEQFRIGYANGGQPGAIDRPVEAGSRQTMYDMGRNARISDNDMGVRIEALISRNTEVINGWQQRWDRMLTEVTRLDAMMLEQAQRRNWCREFDEFCREVGRVNRIVVLTPRERSYSVTLTVEAEPRNTERELNNVSGVYNVEVDSCLRYDVRASFTCSPDDVDSHLDALVDSLNNCDGVTDVTAGDVEEEDD